MKGIKQLLPWRNTSLLGYAIKQSLQSETDAVLLVLGANKDTILSSVETSETTIIINNDWPLGMGTSIAAAIRYIESNKLDFDAVLIRLIDQPLLSVEHYNKLINTYTESKYIISTSYRSGGGVPVIVDRKHFDELMALASDKGAKEIINNHKNIVTKIDSKGRNIDLDDYETYLSYFNAQGK